MRFVITTPVLNGEAFLDETILSVVTQSGPFSIRYHVQDGGSSDATLAILAAWQRRLDTDFPVRCEGVEFSFASAPDSGLYDAVGRGFDACGDGDVMAWINADDRFEPGAFATVTDVLDRHPTIAWLTGRHCIITETGVMLYLSPILPFPRRAIRAGIFDGRFAEPFIQQEGTFWRPALWDKAGGLDARFRLAGDFDLWRRFARHDDLVMADTILGCFRMRAGQLTANMAKYYAELDASLTPDEQRARARASKRYRWAGYYYPILLRRSGGPWTREVLPMRLAPFVDSWALKLERARLKLLSLFDRSITDNRDEMLR